MAKGLFGYKRQCVFNVYLFFVIIFVYENAFITEKCFNIEG